MRADGRTADMPRPVRISRQYTRTAAGSVLVETGDTRVLCTASLEANVPEFLVGTGKGWLTAEYNMLPGSTRPRKKRDRAGKVDGRSVEIQRLIGRSLRSVVRLETLAEHTLWVDCDVLDADGGTRTASITGAFVAVVDAIANSALAGKATEILADSVAAISVGIAGGEALLDLNYREDSAAEVDMNLVMTGGGRLIEVQGTGERTTFSFEDLDRMLAFGRKGIELWTQAQKDALGENWPWK